MNKKPDYELGVRQKLEDGSFGPTQKLYIKMFDRPVIGDIINYCGKEYKIIYSMYMGDRHTHTEGFSIPQTKEEILNASIPATNELPKFVTNPEFTDAIALNLAGSVWFDLSKPNSMSAPDFLRKAQEAMEARAKQRDAANGERSMAKTVAAFNAIYGKELTEEEGWAFMVLLKMVRGSQGKFNDDDYVDGAAYFALLGECTGKSQKPETIVKEFKGNGISVRSEITK